jgi:hypothetical protein
VAGRRELIRSLQKACFEGEVEGCDDERLASAAIAVALDGPERQALT